MSTVTGVARSMGVQVNQARLTATGMDEVQARSLIAPVILTSIPVFNPQGGYASYVVPAAFVLIFQQTLLMGIGLLHAGRKRPSGTQMGATPQNIAGAVQLQIALAFDYTLLAATIYRLTRAPRRQPE